MEVSVIIFNALILLSICMFVGALLPAIFSPTVKRTAGWYSIVSGWLVYAVGYALLIGHQESRPGPPHGLCAFQTVMIYSVPALALCGTLTYFIEFCFVVRNVKSGNFATHTGYRMTALVSAPWIVFILVIAEVLMVLFLGGQGSKVMRSEPPYICHISSHTWSLPVALDSIPHAVLASILGLTTIIAIPLGAWTGWTLYHNWASLNQLQAGVNHRACLAVYIKLTISTLCTTGALGLVFLNLVRFDDHSLQVVGILQPLAYPLGSIINAIVLCTQKDLLEAYLFWRKPSAQLRSIVFHHDAMMTSSFAARSSHHQVPQKSTPSFATISQGSNKYEGEVIDISPSNSDTLTGNMA